MKSCRRLPKLSISVVTYEPDIEILKHSLESLAKSAVYAKSNKIICRLVLILIDNGPGRSWKKSLERVLSIFSGQTEFSKVVLLSGHGNIGYGRGHNLGVNRHIEDFHLVLNPDVIMEKEALYEGIRFLCRYPQIGMVVPSVFDTAENMQYLCKRYPTVLDLALRGFCPPRLQNLFYERLSRHEMRDVINNKPVFDVEIASGCFMLVRRSSFLKAGGFSDKYFMYFEDFDLSLKFGRLTAIAYLPSMKIVHMGGGASRKGWMHIRSFAVSAFKFFNQHGWKFF